MIVTYTGDSDPLFLAIADLQTRATDIVVCLASAAQLHGFGLHHTDELWMATRQGRNIPVQAGHYRLIGISWQQMQAPVEPMELNSELTGGRWSDALSDLELSELYLGIERRSAYGVQYKVTSPARTVCDLLFFRDRPIGRDRSTAEYFTEGEALEILKNYASIHDLDEVRLMADRLGYIDEIGTLIDLADRFTQIIRSPYPK